MSEEFLKTPVVLLIFNRPYQTAKVFSAVRSIRPARLYIVADGPRSGNVDDVASCAKARAIVDDNIDWPCEVFRNYAETNMGCGRKPSSGLTWFFQAETEGIILEDDCVPSPSSFRFFQELLERYRMDQRVMQVSGANLLGKQDFGGSSYCFSRYGGIWGWATWRRAWQEFDYNMALWEERKHDVIWLRSVCETDQECHIRQTLFNMLHKGEIDTWDLQWVFCKLINQGLSIVPCVNMVQNIGFDADATHTLARNRKTLSVISEDINFPLIHPGEVIRDITYDGKYSRHFFRSPSRLLMAVKRMLSYFRIV